MDKKNTAIGVVLLVAALVTLYLAPKPAPPPPKPAQAQVAAATSGTPESSAVAPAAGSSTASSSTPVAASPVANGAYAVAVGDPTGAIITTLGNDYIQAHFTNFGGAIRDVDLKKYPAVQGSPEPFRFNALHSDPLLAFVGLPGLDRTTPFELVSHSSTDVVYRASVNGQIEVTRHYRISPNEVGATDPYQILAETMFKNLTDRPLPPFRVGMSLGTAPPVNPTDNGLQLSTGYSTSGGQTFIRRSQLEAGGGLLGIGAHESRPEILSPASITWAAVKNLFFTSILTPDQPASELVTRRVKLTPELASDVQNAFGLTGIAQFDLKPLPAHGESRLGGNIYVGPKEYKRLSNGDVFKADQDKVMQYGFWNFFSHLLYTLMTWMHQFVPNWGLAIILTTLTLKMVFLPLTLRASRSMKRMQKLQPEMQAIRTKYKDNPQKQQTAMMELYKQHKVNPVGGCIPMLLPMPFFFGFYGMLQGTAELRHAPFLWAHDLSMPDTVGHVLGFPINILPLLLGATMVIQMRLTPQPTVDNAQATMMKFMPLIFMIFCYTFSCALSLYSTVNGLFTIGQQLLINRMKDDGDPAGRGVIAGKPVKNVTPPRGK